MSGIHHPDDHGHHHDHGQHHDHGHHHHGHLQGARPVFYPRPRLRPRSRRVFLGQFGKGTLALAVFTPVLAACGSDGQSSDPGAGDSSAATDSAGTGSGTQAEADTTTSTTASGGAGDDTTGQAAGDQTLRWGRANLGFVSAYVLARGNSAAIVDTGTAGSAAAIGETLQTMGLNYSDVDHLILTHKHGDHAGALNEVLAEAASATVYAGQADLDAISITDPTADDIVPLVGDEDVFGMRMVATPGHTPGHMAVLDEATGLLVAGDALFTEGGGVVEGPERFFDDIPQSRQTIRDLAQLSFNTLLVGHGDPIEGNADTAVADLAASLP